MKFKVAKMTESEFTTLKMQLIESMAETFTSSEQESGYYWRAICDRGHDFDRAQKQVDLLNSLTLQTFQNFFTEVFANPETSKRLEYQLISKHLEVKNQDLIRKHAQDDPDGMKREINVRPLYA